MIGTSTQRQSLSGEPDLPSLFRRTDAAAIRYQRATLVWLRNQVSLLVLAAICAGAPGRLPVGPVDLPSLVSAAAYIAALWYTWLTAHHRPKDNWQLQRSAAELVRSHCWRYAVRGAPYGADARDPDGAFEASVHDGLQQLETIGWREPPGDGSAGRPSPLITTAMRQLRAKPYPVRRETYIQERVQEQQDWYRRRSSESRRAGLLWQFVTVLGTLAALAAAIAKALEWGTSMDLAGMASAAAAASVAWSEVRQYQPLVAAHALVAQELGTRVFALHHVSSESVWAANVEAVEEIISPDHTAWLARHRG